MPTPQVVSQPVSAPTEIEKTVTATKRGKKLLRMKVTRDNEGINVAMQSDIDWKEHLGAGGRAARAASLQVGGILCFESKPIRLNETGGFSNRNGDMQTDGLPNMTMLFAKGLTEGVTFKFTTTPMSGEKLKEWATSVRNAAIEMFNLYIKPVDIELEVSIREKTNEQI